MEFYVGFLETNALDLQINTLCLYYTTKQLVTSNDEPESEFSSSSRAMKVPSRAETELSKYLLFNKEFLFFV